MTNTNLELELESERICGQSTGYTLIEMRIDLYGSRAEKRKTEHERIPGVGLTLEHDDGRIEVYQFSGDKYIRYFI